MLSLKIENFTHAKQAIVLVSESRGAIALQVNSTANGINTIRMVVQEWKDFEKDHVNNVMLANLIDIPEN